LELSLRVVFILSEIEEFHFLNITSVLYCARSFPTILCLRCSKSCVLKTRAMAARALVPLVSGVALQDMLKNLIESLPQSCTKR
jgi:hypothetical protein